MNSPDSFDCQGLLSIKANNMYTKTLKKMKVGEECNIFSPEDYSSLHSARTMLRKDKKQPQYSDWNWQIKLGKGKVTVTRTS